MANKFDKNTTSNIFQTYANVYDDLYPDKNYESECDFIEEVFRRYAQGKVLHILDLGCGTGGHSIPLARRGYKVYGVDSSEQMIRIAQQKAESEGLAAQLQFEVANIQNLERAEKFDAVICMFAVLGYQTSNEELFATLQTVRKHLKPKGLFICDFWYGPAVLKQRPSDRLKILQKDNKQLFRFACSSIDTQNHVVTIEYHLLHLQNNYLLEAKEVHKMRFIFKPEIDFFLLQAGLQLLHFCSFAEFEQKVSEETWNVSAISQVM